MWIIHKRQLRFVRSSVSVVTPQIYLETSSRCPNFPGSETVQIHLLRTETVSGSVLKETTIIHLKQEAPSLLGRGSSSGELTWRSQLFEASLVFDRFLSSCSGFYLLFPTWWNHLVWI